MCRSLFKQVNIVKSVHLAEMNAKYRLKGTACFIAAFMGPAGVDGLRWV